jgi:hypothetical protein
MKEIEESDDFSPLRARRVLRGFNCRIIASLQSKIIHHTSEAASNRDVPLSRGGVARIVPEFCARARPEKHVTPGAARNKEFLARGVFHLFNCCTNVVVYYWCAGDSRRQGPRGQQAGGGRPAGNANLPIGCLRNARSRELFFNRNDANEPCRTAALGCENKRLPATDCCFLNREPSTANRVQPQRACPRAGGVQGHAGERRLTTARGQGPEPMRLSPYAYQRGIVGWDWVPERRVWRLGTQTIAQPFMAG